MKRNKLVAFLRAQEETAFGVFRSPNKAARRVAKKGSVNRLGGSGQVDQSGGANGRRSARTWTGIGWKQESDMAFSQRHRRCVVDKGCGSHALGWIGIGTGAGGWLTVTESQVADHEQQSSLSRSHKLIDKRQNTHADAVAHAVVVVAAFSFPRCARGFQVIDVARAHLFPEASKSGGWWWWWWSIHPMHAQPSDSFTRQRGRRQSKSHVQLYNTACEILVSGHALHTLSSGRTCLL
ncbi:hypothetical protein HDK77DRAFT_502842 [Phyllosticta capitalensis]